MSATSLPSDAERNAAVQLRYAMHRQPELSNAECIENTATVDGGPIVAIGTIHGGEATNIICPSVLMDGIVRTSSFDDGCCYPSASEKVAEGARQLTAAPPNASFAEPSPRWSTMLKWSAAFGDTPPWRLAAMRSSTSRQAAMTLASIPRACPLAISCSVAAHRPTNHMCPRRHSEPPMISLSRRPSAPSETSSIC